MDNIFETKSPLEILLELSAREEIIFEDLSESERFALNQKELIEDNFFIMLTHTEVKHNLRIESLIPLNFYVNKNSELVVYNEDRPVLFFTLPVNTTLTFNKI